MRNSIAQIKPMVLALPCCSWGSLEDMIERKTILSTPNTISRKASVSNAIQADGNKKVSSISILNNLKYIRVTNSVQI